ncbi:HEAT repeat domain-containing protein [Haloarcula salinisoli]|uniref:HEAT repeat domain-containing protein n=1 Tax=Haloarcula salinisoli TaxID=2487746 RepID=A0A8J7YLL9_9EURY|nr:HEAT repeat domain-containing protein [Halomicroarcula salinisoli]MBX0288617.1 HEAT repeat domain-containing protein [Halomicroarcula salinisoli]MBX0306003.1 HEAT repeat domain-containing protein [Halomicroarcula salinisoli]
MYDSNDTIQEILDEGTLFELTYEAADGEKTFLVTHRAAPRPSMIPLDGPPVFYFDAFGGEQTHKVTLPELRNLTPVSVDTLADPLMDHAISAMVTVADETPESVVVDDVLSAIAATSDSDGDVYSVLQLVYLVIDDRTEAVETLVGPVLPLLQDSETAIGRAILEQVLEQIEAAPESFEQHVQAFIALADHPVYGVTALRGLVELAEADATTVLDAIPALEVAATSDDEEARQWAVYALSVIAGDHPGAVYPAVDVLIECLQRGDESTLTNVLSALGKITSAYPDAAEPVTADLVALLDDESKRTRNNAVGLLGDIAQQHPDIVVEYAAPIAGRLSDPNIQARINASSALLEAGEADPAAIRAQHEALEAALDDASPEVRANACTLIGNSEAPVSVELVKEVRDSDLDSTVRERAAMAVERLS